MKTLTLLLTAPLLAATLAAQPAPAVLSSPPPAEPEQTSPADAPGEARPADEAEPSQEQFPGVAEALTTWTCFTMKPAVARKAVMKHRRQVDLFKWCTEQSLIPESGVKMEFITSVPCRSGQRSKIESIVEYPYPTEADPPSGQAGSAGPPPKADPILPPMPPSPSPVNPSMIPPPPPAAPGEMQTYPFIHYAAPWPVTPATPQSFESKNTGVTLEVEVNVGDDRRFADVNIAPEDIRVLSVIPWSHTGDVVQPCFGTRKVASQVLAKLGEPTLAGTFSRTSGTGVPGTAAEPSTSLLFFTAALQ